MTAIPSVVLVAGNTVRELVRKKLLYNLLLFAILLIGSSMFVAQLTIGQWDRVILDMGLAAIELSSVVVAILLGVGLVAGEIERRTIFPVLAKPVGRGAFLLGRYLGLVAMLAGNILVMLAVLAGVLRLAGYPLSATSAGATLLLFIEMAVIAALAIFFSAFTAPVLATAFSFSLFLVGHLLSDLRTLGERSHAALGKAAARVCYLLLPDLELFNLKSQAANQLALPRGFLSSSALYGCAYAAAVLVLAIAIFRKRDLK